jgi:hypothetical protein
MSAATATISTATAAVAVAATLVCVISSNVSQVLLLSTLQSCTTAPLWIQGYYTICIKAEISKSNVSIRSAVPYASC